MNIAARISELLFEYECVVLPGLGAFISNDKPAQINRITHQFHPPYREILFNVQLTANDGLLAKYIAEKESITYKEAKYELNEFVISCQDDLKLGNRIEFSQIGHLFFNEAQHIAFEQDEQVNYNPLAFGLSSFVSPAIKRISQEEKIKGILLSGTNAKNRVDRKPDRNAEKKQSKKSIYFLPITLASLLVMVVLITSIFLPSQSSIISLAGLFSPSSTEVRPDVKSVKQPTEVNEPNIEASLPLKKKVQEATSEESERDITNKVDNNPKVESVDKFDETADASESGIQSNELLEVDQPKQETPKPDKPKDPSIDNSTPEVAATAKQYYIIAGSFSKAENAKKLVSQLVGKGFTAVVADTSKNGMYRVAYGAYQKKKDATQELYTIRVEENAEAWLLRK